MTAKEFIVKNYPVTAKEFENKKCLGLNDIAYICEKYHDSKVLAGSCQHNWLKSNFKNMLFCGNCGKYKPEGS